MGGRRHISSADPSRAHTCTHKHTQRARLLSRRGSAEAQNSSKVQGELRTGPRGERETRECPGGRYQGSWGELSVPEDRLLWLPSVSILLSAGIFPHCEARRGSEAPLLLLLLLQTQGRAAEGGREAGRRAGEVGVGRPRRRRAELGNTLGRVDTHADARHRRQRQSPPPASLSRRPARPGPPPAAARCLPLFMLPVALRSWCFPAVLIIGWRFCVAH